MKKGEDDRKGNNLGRQRGEFGGGAGLGVEWQVTSIKPLHSQLPLNCVVLRAAAGHSEVTSCRQNASLCRDWQGGKRILTGAVILSPCTAPPHPTPLTPAVNV